MKTKGLHALFSDSQYKKTIQDGLFILPNDLFFIG